jgi:hypothetical protein
MDVDVLIAGVQLERIDLRVGTIVTYGVVVAKSASRPR